MKSLEKLWYLRQCKVRPLQLLPGGRGLAYRRDFTDTDIKTDMSADIIGQYPTM